MTGISSVTAADFEVTDKNGNPINVTNATTEKLTIDNTDYINKAPYTVIYTDTDKNKDTVVANIASSLLDAEFAYDENDLGWHNGVAKVWAPLATKAEILIYDDMATAKTDYESNPADASVTPVAMTNEGKGVWSANVPEGKYYMYQLENDGNTYRVCDIYANAASPDSVAAKAVDIANKSWAEATYINPWGNNGTESKKYTEAVIYEMHIRDWSRAFVKDSTGKFDDITNALKNNGAFAQHLKDLGVTHVQILPMFDYAQTNDDDSYNWGYNPYQYNVPEGRYVNNHDNDAEAAVDQMRNMIAAFHEAGIAVNMDVVYNHTNRTGIGSLFDMTVPKYYYRLTADGNYSSGSGCGNEMASNAAMYKKFMIDSLKHWMTDYHINGFRFDLMGLHETSTMKAVYNALKEIDPNVMVYGEPWTGGTSPVVNGVDKNKIDNCSSSSNINGVGCFNDDYRNAIKGAEFGGFQKGQVQGVFSGAINSGLMGSVAGDKKFTNVIGRSLNYVECHDNYTLFDKLSISLNGGKDKTGYKAYKDFTPEQQTELRNQNKLAAAFVFLAQGTPFINGGQEFMRTKHGDENSYISDDSINAIDLTLKTTFNDVYNVYKGLIALRKSSDAFTVGTDVLAETVKALVDGNEKNIRGFTKYVTTGTDDSYCVYFNATTENQAIDTTGYTKVVDVTSGAVTESTTLPATVAAKSFVILKK
ncbi:MAG: alpha-amylase [Spirochaetales bacterium]|nr:alpha-amylase [Spirochaetales bacterium]